MEPKVLSVAALAVLLIAAPAGAAPIVDYVDNGGFEDFEDTEPVDWRVLAGDPAPTTEAAEGDLAVQFALEGDDLEATIAQNVSLLYQDVEDADPPTPSGTSYELNFSAKLGTGSDNEPTDIPDSQAIVIWKDALGQEVDRDTVTITESSAYEDYEVVLQAPLPEPGELPVTEAELRFTLERDTLTDRTDANLFLDSVEFGPVLS